MFENLESWQLALIVFISQTIFLWFRTLNVIYTSKLKVLPSLLTGIGIGLAWLIAVAIGIDSILKLQLLPIIGYILGGALGTYIGLIKEKRKHDKNISRY